MISMVIPSWEELRERMVREQLEKRGLIQPRILDVMRRVPRHLFVPEAARNAAYEDRALPIGFDQTISQPYMVAVMLRTLDLQGSEKVLEIGTGSGYEAALLGLLAKEVHTVDIVPELVLDARKNLALLEMNNVHVHTADGSSGFPSAAPYDAILVAAGSPDVPPLLVSQLGPGGKLLLPIGDRKKQMLTLVQKNGNEIVRQPLGACAFVPLLGAFGWPAA
jgi:protein-L-isoaspartate(D-aspartate) O-methyltransferase